MAIRSTKGNPLRTVTDRDGRDHAYTVRKADRQAALRIAQAMRDMGSETGLALEAELAEADTVSVVK